MSAFVGVDPGITGAVGWIDGEQYGVFDIPVQTASEKGAVRWMVDAERLAGTFVDVPFTWKGSTVALEQTSAMPGQGVASMFSMGDSFGACRAVLNTLGFDVRLVRPAAWKKDMGLRKEKGETSDDAKQKSLDMARSMFPDAPLTRKKDHNRAEALLLAHWIKTREM